MRRTLTGLFLAQWLLALSPADVASDTSAFNGTWRRQITASAPRSRKPKELVIKTEANTLAVKMTGAGKAATVDVVFQIGGPNVTYTGLDGDQFTLKARLEGADVVLEGTELEDGRTLTIHEVWTTKTEGHIDLLVDSRSTKSEQNSATRTTVYERVRQPK